MLKQNERERKCSALVIAVIASGTSKVNTLVYIATYNFQAGTYCEPFGTRFHARLVDMQIYRAADDNARDATKR